MRRFAIILAGGEGRRAGGDKPKQMVALCGHPLLWWSLRNFQLADPTTEIILVMHPGLFVDWDVALSEMKEPDRIPHILCCGGRTRTESVANALKMLRDILAETGCDPADVAVAVHDAARPLASARLIERGWKAIAPGVVALPALPPVSSLRKIETDGSSESVDRSLFREVQTPQIALADSYFDAYFDMPEGSFTDDASLLQAKGAGVVMFEGDPANFKVTYPDDFIMAEALTRARSKEWQK